MSTTIDVAFVKQFEREVHLAYQRWSSIVRGTIRTVSGVKGESTTFQKIGQGSSAKKTRHGQIPVMNLEHTNVICTLEDYYTGEWIDKLDLLKINHDEREAVTRSSAAAQGRTTDQIILNAMDDATNSTAITLSSAASIRNSFLEAIKALKTRDVPMDGQVWGLMPPSLEAALMTIDPFANADYVGPELPYKGAGMGKVRTWLNVHWQTHTGLPLATNTRTGFIYHRSAVGHAIGQDIQTDIDWHNDHASWFVATSLSMGAVLIDNNGVQELTIDESTALPTS